MNEINKNKNKEYSVLEFEPSNGLFWELSKKENLINEKHSYTAIDIKRNSDVYANVCLMTVLAKKDIYNISMVSLDQNFRDLERKNEEKFDYVIASSRLLCDQYEYATFCPTLYDLVNEYDFLRDINFLSEEEKELEADGELIALLAAYRMLKPGEALIFRASQYLFGNERNISSPIISRMIDLGTIESVFYFSHSLPVWMDLILRYLKKVEKIIKY